MSVKATNGGLINMNEIKQRIYTLLKERKSDIDISKDTSDNLIESGVIDSMDIVELLTSIEDAFGIEVDGDDIIPENFESIDSIEKLVIKYKK